MRVDLSELNGFAADVRVAADNLPKRARSVTARRLDKAAAQAQSLALELYSDYGRGMAGAAGTFRARMSRDGQPVGWVLGNDAAFYQEHGTSRHAPQPVLGPVQESNAGPWADEMAEVAEGLWP